MRIRSAPVSAMAVLGVASLASLLIPWTARAQAVDLEKQVANAAAAIARSSGTARSVRLGVPPAPAAFVRAPQTAGAGAGESGAGEARSSGFISSLNELLAPKEVLLDVTRLGSPDFKRNFAVVGAGLGLAALAADDVDEAFIGVREPSLDDFSESMSFLGGRAFLYPALVTSFFIGKAVDRPDVARTAAQMTQALLLTDILVTPIKLAVGRTRPDGSNDRSFPSGHTAGAFALATVLQHNYGYRVGLPAYAFAGLVGIARVDERKHFVSDVIAGAAIGFLAASTVNQRFPGYRVNMYVIHPPGGGRGVGITLEF